MDVAGDRSVWASLLKLVFLRLGTVVEDKPSVGAEVPLGKESGPRPPLHKLPDGSTSMSPDKSAISDFRKSRLIESYFTHNCSVRRGRKFNDI